MKKRSPNVNSGKPNPSNLLLEGPLSITEIEHGEIHTNEQVCTNVQTTVDSKGTPILFRKGVQQQDVSAALFILEGEKGFESMSLREKYTLVARAGDARFRRWYTDNGASNKLPNNWGILRKKLHCTARREDKTIKKGIGT